MSKRKQRNSDHEQKTLPMLIPMNRRMALKVMAVAAATPSATAQLMRQW